MGLGQDRAWDAPVCSVREVAAYVRVMWTLCALCGGSGASRCAAALFGGKIMRCRLGFRPAVVARGRLASRTRGGVRRVLALPSSASVSHKKCVYGWDAGRAELGEGAGRGSVQRVGRGQTMTHTGASGFAGAGKIRRRG